jgi:hypothetical protein
MVSSGMQRAGYVYVNVDDTWGAGRDLWNGQDLDGAARRCQRQWSRTA